MASFKQVFCDSRGRRTPVSTCASRDHPYLYTPACKCHYSLMKAAVVLPKRLIYQSDLASVPENRTIRRTWYAVSCITVNHSVVHQCTVSVCLFSSKGFCVLVQTHIHGATFVRLMPRHQPPCVLQGPSSWALVCSWYHELS